MNETILELNGLSVEMLQTLSYRSALGISLKRTLRHFDRSLILGELQDMTDWLDEQEVLADVALDYRIKSLSSLAAKYDRYVQSSRQAREVFNDTLGFRAFCDDYQPVLALDAQLFRIADLSHGKAVDDGYRGVHVYFQASAAHYPIEIQYNTLYDRQLNNWLHEYLYKTDFPAAVGAQMRRRYEAGEIRTEAEFQEVLNDVLSGGERHR